MNAHGAVRDKRYHVVIAFTNINGITVPPVNKSTIGYFKSVPVVRVSFRSPVIAPALRFPEADVVEALIQADGLTEAEALDQAQQERGLERYYFEWLKRLAFDLAQGDYLFEPSKCEPPFTQEERASSGFAF